jgi:hypothetical protein
MAITTFTDQHNSKYTLSITGPDMEGNTGITIKGIDDRGNEKTLVFVAKPNQIVPMIKALRDSADTDELWGVFIDG